MSTYKYTQTSIIMKADKDGSGAGKVKAWSSTTPVLLPSYVGTGADKGALPGGRSESQRPLGPGVGALQLGPDDLPSHAAASGVYPLQP